MSGSSGSNCIYWDLNLETPSHLFIKHSENCKSELMCKPYLPIISEFPRNPANDMGRLSDFTKKCTPKISLCLIYFLWGAYMFRKWFSHCGKITDNFPCIHPVRGRQMFETLIFQECFIFLKMWQKTFSTINSGGKKWRNKWIRPRTSVQKAKLEQTTRKHTN